ncbi:unnamed protein product [Trypanosoma congolense IL3000]|uniref:WGS project CAEQ00000000 data, annotated contig 2220 n=1 Tax=Trypanosoma congolense (strain IL3000) TaxID=1068625 RepID=F9WCE8_TRYCI|nr:unnamed protein product [Trypanosoma congolense IL3000]
MDQVTQPGVGVVVVPDLAAPEDLEVNVVLENERQSEDMRAALAGGAHARGVNPQNAEDAKRRLMRDLKQLHTNKNERFWARPESDNLFKWKAVVLGPEDTIWEGGVFKLWLEFSDEYPCAPPSAHFVTKMFHPNVYVNGDICLDTLKSNWSPTLDVESVLLMITSLLSDPNPSSAANGEAAKMFAHNRDKYEERVRRLVEESLEQAFSDEDDGDEE